MSAAQASAELRALVAPALPALIPQLTGRFVDAEAAAIALTAFVADPAAQLEDEAARFVLEDIALDEDIDEAAQLAAFGLHLADRLASQDPSDTAEIIWPVWANHIASLPEAERDTWHRAAREMTAHRLSDLPT